MNYLHVFLCISLCICGLLVCISFNPVESVLFLILSFCNAAAILFLFNTEFLGLIFIIVYVGAIAVLFLFVIMMLNIKNQKESFEGFGSFISLIYFSIFYFFVFSIFLVLKKSFFQNLDVLDINLLDISLFIDDLNNIDVLGQVLYNYFLICFLLAGLILLIALIGAIVLTLRFNNLQKGQQPNRQLARVDNFLSFFK